MLDFFALLKKKTTRLKIPQDLPRVSATYLVRVFFAETPYSKVQCGFLGDKLLRKYKIPLEKIRSLHTHNLSYI